MTIPRRIFLQLFGSSIGTLACGSLTAQTQRRLNFTALTNSRKALIAHRGASSYRPEYTLDSYQLALEQDADFVEQDLQITRDGQLIVQIRPPKQSGRAHSKMSSVHAPSSRQQVGSEPSTNFRGWDFGVLTQPR